MKRFDRKFNDNWSDYELITTYKGCDIFKHWGDYVDSFYSFTFSWREFDSIKERIKELNILDIAEQLIEKYEKMYGDDVEEIKSNIDSLQIKLVDLANGYDVKVSDNRRRFKKKLDSKRMKKLRDKRILRRKYRDSDNIMYKNFEIVYHDFSFVINNEYKGEGWLLKNWLEKNKINFDWEHEDLDSAKNEIDNILKDYEYYLKDLEEYLTYKKNILSNILSLLNETKGSVKNTLSNNVVREISEIENKFTNGNLSILELNTSNLTTSLNNYNRELERYLNELNKFMDDLADFIEEINTII